MTKKTDLARRFAAEVKQLARKYDVDFFVVTDGASAVSSRGCEAVDHARRSHTEWERAHGIDPEHDWSREE